MKIAIEAQRIFRNNKHGMDFVALEIIRQLQRIDTENEYFIFVSPGPDRCLNESANFHIIELKCPTYPLWEQIALPCAVRRIKPDVLHCTSNTAPVWGKTPLVITLHDIIYLEKQTSANGSMYQRMGRIYRRWNVPRVIKRCKAVITVSEYEKQRIDNQLGGTLGCEVEVVYNGFGEHFYRRDNAEEVTGRYIAEKNFVMFLGNTDPKKNTPATIRAYAKYLKLSKSPSHLLVADHDRRYTEQILCQAGMTYASEYIHPSGYIANSDLPYLYSSAKAFLYTSLRESFGIPLLEAMACGTPVVASGTSSIPEIGGSQMEYVDPTDEDAIAAMLVRLEEDTAFRERQIACGYERTKEFSWRKAAEKVLDIYRRMGKRD